MPEQGKKMNPTEYILKLLSNWRLFILYSEPGAYIPCVVGNCRWSLDVSHRASLLAVVEDLGLHLWEEHDDAILKQWVEDNVA